MEATGQFLEFVSAVFSPQTNGNTAVAERPRGFFFMPCFLSLPNFFFRWLCLTFDLKGSAAVVELNKEFPCCGF